MENFGGYWDEASGSLLITGPGGAKFRVQHPVVTERGQKVFRVETINKELHLFTGPPHSTKPVRRVRFSIQGCFLGCLDVNGDPLG